MANLNFKGGRRDRLYSAQLNSLAYANKNGVLVGCVATKGSNLRNVNISDGSIFYGLNTITVENTVVAIPSNSSSNDRLDLIVVNQSGVISLVQGNASVVPSTPDYDPEVFICLAIIRARGNAISIIPEDIIDNRVENIGGSGSGGGTFLRKTQPFEDESEIVVLHNFGDSEPLVFVYDDDNKIIIPDEVEVVSNQEIKVTLSSSSTGVVVVYGGTGVNNAYYSSKFSNNTTWNVEHNLNQKYVTVQCVDDNDKQIFPNEIEYIDENNLIVTFGQNQTGRVVCSGGSSQFDNIDGNVTTVQIKRGTDSSRETTELEEGELFYTKDTKELYIGDGVTNGGVLVNEKLDLFTPIFTDNGFIFGEERYYEVISPPISSGVTSGNIQGVIDYEFFTGNNNNFPKPATVYRNGGYTFSHVNGGGNNSHGVETKIKEFSLNVNEGVFLQASFYRSSNMQPGLHREIFSIQSVNGKKYEFFSLAGGQTQDIRRDYYLTLVDSNTMRVIILDTLVKSLIIDEKVDVSFWDLTELFFKYEVNRYTGSSGVGSATCVQLYKKFFLIPNFSLIIPILDDARLAGLAIISSTF